MSYKVRNFSIVFISHYLSYIRALKYEFRHLPFQGIYKFLDININKYYIYIREFLSISKYIIWSKTLINKTTTTTNNPFVWVCLIQDFSPYFRVSLRYTGVSWENYLYRVCLRYRSLLVKLGVSTTTKIPPMKIVDTKENIVRPRGEDKYINSYTK